ncbi:alpha/beta hydrolase [Actibacterium sp.]|uniref:alpha/beta hydrolase n=1 Tax=Actibacterium sp. TaxID=1872125 RepID=UPI00356B5106
MSIRRRILNRTLRLFERRHLARVSDPAEMRRSFEMKARVWFRPPRGSEFRRGMLGDVPVLWAHGPTANRDSVILYFHGGGYVMGSSRTHRAMLATVSQMSGVPACLPDYRMAPEHLFPAAFDDGLASYKALLEAGYRGDQIILGGDSAGGGLALAVLAAICREGLPQPLMSFAFSPLTDLTMNGASHRSNYDREVMLPPEKMHTLAQEYLNGGDPRDPRIAPLYGNFRGAGPVYLWASTHEILLDDTRNMAARLKEQGVEVRSQIEHGLPHVWPMFHNILPEGQRSLERLAAQIRVRVDITHPAPDES